MTHVSIQEKQGLEELFLCLSKQQQRRCPKAFAKEIRGRILRFWAKARRKKKAALGR